MVGTEVATVVARGNSDDIGGTGRSMHAHFRRLLHRFQGQPIDDDLIDGIDALGKCGFRLSAQRRAVGIVGARPELFVFAADFTPGPDDTAGKRRDDIGNQFHCADGGTGRL